MSGLSRRLPLLFLAVLALLLAVSAYLRLQFDFNAGHMDEYDYLFVGHRLLSGLGWPSYTYIFGSDLNWYLLGLGDRLLGGLSGARMVSGIFGLLSLLGMYFFVYVLWRSRLIALIAASLLALQSIQLFISRFATYDIISFACFSLALAPLILACQKTDRSRYLYLLLSVVLMSLAVTSKYVVILYMPLVAGLALLRSPKIGFSFGALVGAILIAYVALHWEALQRLYEVQIKGVHGTGNGSFEYIIWSEIKYLWLPLSAWLIAVVWRALEYGRGFWRDRQWHQLLLLGLFALPMAAYHLNALNMISLFKHLVYSLYFLIPASAWLIGMVLKEKDFRYLKQSLASIAVVGFSFLSYQQLLEMETAYADVSPILQQVDGELNHQSTILSEDPYLFRYLGVDTIPQIQIKESGWLDNNRDGKHEAKDVIDAIWDSKFSYVYLNDQLHPSLNVKLRKMLALKKYQPLWSENYEISDVMSRKTKGTMSLYRRTESPRLSLLKDDLFGRGKDMKVFKARSIDD